MKLAGLVSAIVLSGPLLAFGAAPDYNRSSCLTVANNNREGTSPGVWIRNTCNVKIEFVFCTTGPVKDYFNCASKPSDPRYYQQGESGIGPGGEEPMPTSPNNRLLFFACDWSGLDGHYPLPKITAPTYPPQGFCEPKGAKPQEGSANRHPGGDALKAMLGDEFAKSPQVKAPASPTAPANGFPPRGAGANGGCDAEMLELRTTNGNLGNELSRASNDPRAACQVFRRAATTFQGQLATVQQCAPEALSGLRQQINDMNNQIAWCRQQGF